MAATVVGARVLAAGLVVGLGHAISALRLPAEPRSPVLADVRIIAEPPTLNAQSAAGPPSKKDQSPASQACRGSHVVSASASQLRACVSRLGRTASQSDALFGDSSVDL
jgi:hypothetical protein